MKKLYLLCTRPWIYLSEIPLLVLLILSIINNAKSDGVWKLYPLIILLSAGIIFILLYFFKLLILSKDEAEIFTIFTEGDNTSLVRGKMLIIGRISPARIKVCVFGNDGKPPEFDFVENDAEYTPIDIFLLRSKALGGNRSLMNIMTYFLVPEEDAKKLLHSNGSYEDTVISVTSEPGKNGYQEIKIKFKKTL